MEMKYLRGMCTFENHDEENTEKVYDRCVDVSAVSL